MLYSLLPHKELRFIFPAIPLLNLGAAATCVKVLNALQSKSGGQMLKISAHLFLLGVLLGSALLTVVFSLASIHNYPGGRALDCLHKLSIPSEQVKLGGSAGDCDNFGPVAGKPLSLEEVPPEKKVHIGVAAAQQGVSLFGEEFRQRQWVYSKEEKLRNEDYDQFDYLLMSETEQAESLGEAGFRLRRRIRSFGGLDATEIASSLGTCLIRSKHVGEPSDCVKLGMAGADILLLERDPRK
mmetsp:Transcript_13332/g.49507  ORF Transcript_13332/g.49507 Transcript_13332/m.49507 type:complete len:240 (-) Transcript_13332:2517-3236(-)